MRADIKKDLYKIMKDHNAFDSKAKMEEFVRNHNRILSLNMARYCWRIWHKETDI